MTIRTSFRNSCVCRLPVPVVVAAPLGLAAPAPPPSLRYGSPSPAPTYIAEWVSRRPITGSVTRSTK